jgi:hypothetical protein
MTTEQWKHLALIAHHCYGSFDLALRAVTMLAKADLVSADAPELYMQDLRSASRVDIRSTWGWQRRYRQRQPTTDSALAASDIRRKWHLSDSAISLRM